MLKRIKLDKILVAILILGFLIRVAGSTHGFPFIFHPDEPAVVRSALGIRFDINPAHFDWPHMHFYLNFMVYWLFMKFRGALQILQLRQFLSPIFPLLWRDPLVFYFLSRLLNVFLGTLTAIPVFLAGKRLFNKNVGYLSALVLMFTPLHVHASTFALIDIPTAFWVAWGLYFSVKIFESGDIKNYLLAGLFVGFAASTKYNGGLSALMVPIAHFLRTFKSDSEKLISFEGLKALFLSGLFAFFGFVVGTPFSVLDYETFSRTDGPKGAFWQFVNVGTVAFSKQIYQFFQSLTYGLANDFGYVFMTIYTLTALYTVFVKRSKELFLILLPSLFIFYYVSGFSKPRSHYFLSTYPFVALIVGVVLERIISLKKPSRSAKLALLLAIFAIPTYFSLLRMTNLVKKDTRVLMYEYLLEKVEETDSIFYNSEGMLPVIEKFSKNYTKKETQEITGKGYFLVGLNDDELVSFEKGVHEDSGVVAGFEKILEISGKGRRGDNIIIYAFDQP